MDDIIHCICHGPLFRIKTGGDRSRVRELGSIGIFSFFVTLSNVVGVGFWLVGTGWLLLPQVYKHNLNIPMDPSSRTRVWSLSI